MELLSSAGRESMTFVSAAPSKWTLQVVFLLCITFIIILNHSGAMRKRFQEMTALRNNNFSHTCKAFRYPSAFFTSTRIISSPIWHTSLNGMMYSFSRPKIPHRHPGPGTIRWVIQPFSGLNSTSPTKPSIFAVTDIETFVFFKSKNTHRPHPGIKHPYCSLCV